MTHTPVKQILHPYCNTCGWRKGGTDSWDGVACKCGHAEAPIDPVLIGKDRIECDRAWRSPDKRALFEEEIGERDPQSAAYERRFRQWWWFVERRR